MITFSPTEELFISRYLATGNAALSAREAGYSSPAPLLKNPYIREAIEVRRKKSAETQGYTIDVAMREARQGMLFAKRTANGNAYAKCIELRMKLNGLLVDKIDARIVGGFSIRIEGIDDRPALPPPIAPISPVADAVARQLAQKVVEQLAAKNDAEVALSEEQIDDIDLFLEDAVPELPPVNKRPLAKKGELQLPTKEEWEELL